MEETTENNMLCISVIIPAYNAALYIERAIQSVLTQTRPVEEIVIVDDGSTDNTADVVAAYGDKVVMIRQENSGASAARNTGIKAAKGNWIAFLDADDEWLPEKLKLQCDLLQKHPELNWVSGNYYRCDCLNGHQRVIHMNSEKESEVCKQMMCPDYFEDYFIAFSSYAAGNMDTMLIKKEMILKAGLFCQQQPVLEDDDLWLRLAYMDIEYGFVFEPLVVYHLGVQQSLTKMFKDSLVIDAYMHRHLKLSAEAGKLDQFRKCARGMLSHRLRLLFSCGKGSQVRMLIEKYGDILTPSFRKSCYVGSFCPCLWNWKESIKKRIRSCFNR